MGIQFVAGCTVIFENQILALTEIPVGIFMIFLLQNSCNPPDYMTERLYLYPIKSGFPPPPFFKESGALY